MTLSVLVYDHDLVGADDFIGGCSFGRKELKATPVDGWFKLLSEGESVETNVPISYSKNKIEALKMSMDSMSLLDSGFYYGKKTEVTDYKLDTKISESGMRI